MKEEEFYLSNDKKRNLIIGSLGGIGLGIYLTRRFSRNPQLLRNASTFGLAGRALGIGTLISVSSFGVAMFVISHLLDVRCWSDLRKLARKSMIEDEDANENLEIRQYK